MLAKLPPELPIRPITKRPCQQTPKASGLLPLPLRLTKLTSTSTPTAFNSSQVDKLEFKEERGAIVISKLESKEESKNKEEEDNNITCANKFLDQDLEELGPDRLDRENIDELNVEREVDKEIKSSKSFS